MKKIAVFSAMLFAAIIIGGQATSAKAQLADSISQTKASLFSQRITSIRDKINALRKQINQNTSAKTEIGKTGNTIQATVPVYVPSNTQTNAPAPETKINTVARASETEIDNIVRAIESVSGQISPEQTAAIFKAVENVNAQKKQENIITQVNASGCVTFVCRSGKTGISAMVGVYGYVVAPGGTAPNIENQAPTTNDLYATCDGNEVAKITCSYGKGSSIYGIGDNNELCCSE